MKQIKVCETESQVNDWIKKNPQYTIHDIKFQAYSSGFSPMGNSYKYRLFMIIYDDIFKSLIKKNSEYYFNTNVMIGQQIVEQGTICIAIDDSFINDNGIEEVFVEFLNPSYSKIKQTICINVSNLTSLKKEDLRIDQ